MPQHSQANAPICPACDGFARAAIATGTRHPDGTRVTIAADCRTCHGTGHLPVRRPTATARA
ncbi:hypothetical protein [Kitasatospora sp. DSM 101779]|uniref:hypothetical protein n=1 Tax=Kitasatospora sp. DSM 101779 TaxID=2853165 RepID=UPI0021D98CAB|nr:hypothetical protein [Kitasatospora sp. DSM 101779]MCU7824804.1 hypothetical protein [Kitasatospora sp. DSM 101779]